MGRFNTGGGKPRKSFGNRDSSGRDFHSGGFNRDRISRGGRREMFKAVCSNCGKDCEVPFRPTGNKPVYCSDCFEKMTGGRGRFENAPRDRQGFDRRNDQVPQNNAQLDAINRKLDKILGLLTPQPTISQTPVIPTPTQEIPVNESRPVVEKVVSPKKVKSPKRKAKTKKVV